MKASSFEIIRQPPSGELQAEIELEYDNSTGTKIHAIRYAVNFSTRRTGGSSASSIQESRRRKW